MKTTPIEEALYNHAALRTVGLGPRPGRYRRGDIHFAGGALVKWDERTFIVTAGHFLGDGAPPPMSVLFAPEGGIVSLDCTVEKLRRVVQDRSEKTVSSSVELNPVAVFRSPIRTADVAAIEVDPRTIPPWCPPYELSDSAVALPEPGRPVLVVGQPMATSDVRGNDAGVHSGYSAYLSLNVPVTREENPGAWTEEFSSEPVFDPGFHFAMHLDFAKANFDVQGMSGCGVWGAPLSSPQDRVVWRPRLELLGIQVSQLKSRNALKATRIDVVRALLQGTPA